MKQSCTSTFRRSAAVGAAVAIVAASSAFGIGATAAVAAPTTTDATTAATSTTTAGASAATTPTTGSTEGTPTPAEGTPTPVETPTTGAASDGTSTTPAGSGTPGAAATDPAATEPASTDPATETAAAGPSAETPAATPAPTPTAAPTGDAKPTADQPAPAASTPVTWADASSRDEPIVLTATAGTPFSHTFTAQGGDGPLEYLFNPLGFDPSNDVNGWTWNEKTGVLSATPKSTFDGPVMFEVTATDLHQSAVQYVEIDLRPGAPVGVTFSVSGADSAVGWQVDADGTIRQWTPGGTGQTVVSEVPATVGSSLTLAGLAVDALGNRTTPGEEYPRSTVTSTIASDTVAWNAARSSNAVSFSEAGTRTLTVSEGGVSTSFTVRVTDAPAPAPAPVAGIAIGVLPDAGSANAGDSWGVDGDVITQHSSTHGSHRVDAIPVGQGERMQIRALAVDAEGQPVGEHTDLSITSDVASDRIEYDPETAATWVTFEHASRHTITVSYGDVTSTIRFEVEPAKATTVVSTTHTPSASGTLAYTGADETGPLAWALGLLAAGGGMLVHRLRRRRS